MEDKWPINECHSPFAAIVNEKSAQVYTLRKSLAAFVLYMDKAVNKPTNSTSNSNRPQTTGDCIDISAIRMWLHCCDHNHGNHCGTWPIGQETDYTGPTWLIDTHQNCIVAAKPHYSYYALSYVWGLSPSTSLTTDNIRTMQSKDILLSKDVIIPETIRDAMRLVHQLQGRYLWVDRLCIPQNDPVMQKRELDAMATIYARAYVTIVAAQGGDADEGIHGIPGGMKPRGKTQPPMNSQLARPKYRRERTLSIFYTEPAPDFDVLTLDWHSHALLKSTWASRGWTFQEQLFSRRKLVFQNDTVNWECHCVAWYEPQQDLGILASRPCSGSPNSRPIGFDVTPWPDMYRYARLVALFNIRDLTYQEDVLDAFAGLLAETSKSFTGGFISGLPQMFFDATLLWQPHVPMDRRMSSAEHNPVLPSWSWVGWQGSFQSESWRSAYSYLKDNPDEYDEYAVVEWEPCEWRTIPTVSWSHSVDLKSPRIPVARLLFDGGSFSEQPQQGATVNPFPSGWTQRWCQTSGRVYYIHDDVPNQEFWYPVPIRKLNQSTGERTIGSMHSRFLHCQTRKADLIISTPIRWAPSKCLSLNLVDAQGTWAGAIRLNEPRYGVIEGTPSSEFLEGSVIELIELSRGEVKNQRSGQVWCDEWNLPECPRHTGVYSFYNVMWVEWVDGIAYRKAVGRVVDSVWERVTRERVDVVLG